MDALSAFSNPHKFMAVSKPFAWGFTALGVVIVIWGIYQGLYVAPPDYQQGDAAKIMFVHVPSSWLTLFIYAFMSGASFISFVWRSPLADICAKSCAPIGAAFTFICLITGSIWGRPMWGTWWEWDARLTSELVLLFLYLGYIALWRAIEDPIRAAKAAAVLALVGIVNVPIIHFSVEWWRTLHQPASVFRLEGPTIHITMLWPLLLAGLGFMVLFAAVLLVRMRTEILERRLRTERLQLAEPFH